MRLHVFGIAVRIRIAGKFGMTLMASWFFGRYLLSKDISAITSQFSTACI
jgi:hypothetical protein